MIALKITLYISSFIFNCSKNWHNSIINYLVLFDDIIGTSTVDNIWFQIIELLIKKIQIVEHLPSTPSSIYIERTKVHCFFELYRFSQGTKCLVRFMEFFEWYIEVRIIESLLYIIRVYVIRIFDLFRPNHKDLTQYIVKMT